MDALGTQPRYPFRPPLPPGSFLPLIRLSKHGAGPAIWKHLPARRRGESQGESRGPDRQIENLGTYLPRDVTLATQKSSGPNRYGRYGR